MTKSAFSIQFPTTNSKHLTQDNEYFILEYEGRQNRVRFHDYDKIFSIPGLYEHLFYDKLKCNSPKTVCSLLEKEIHESCINPLDLAVLDVGAGNGMVGEQLNKIGVKSVVGIDIIEEAAQATKRDRPEVYDDYYVADLIDLPDPIRKELDEKVLNCLTTVAALGFGDIPPLAFAEAYNLISLQGLVAFNIKDKFLDKQDSSGFSKLISRMVEDDILHIHSQQRYRHRLSLDGKPLYYVATVGTKNAHIPEELLGEFVA